LAVAKIIPSEVKIPIAAPDFLIASIAYSTYSSLPSLEKAFVLPCCID